MNDPNNRLPIGTLGGLSAFSKGLRLDPGIRRYVEVLRSQSVETFESCQGGKGHSYAEPTVAFHGNRAAGLRALQVALDYGLNPKQLLRYYNILDNEAVGPYWAIVF